MSSEEFYSQIAQQCNSQNFSEAQRLLEVAIAQWGTSFDSYFYEGIIAFSLQDFSSAITSLSKAYELNPNDLRVIYNLGVSCTKLEQYADAMGWFKKVIQQKPDHIPTLLMISATFDVTGNPSSSESTCRMILRHDPNNVSALNNLGNACKNSGKPFEAVEAYEKALTLNPKVDLIRSNLLFALNYAATDPIALCNDHEQIASYWINPRWNHTISSKNNRKLRIGFVSPDFCKHSCAYFLRGLYTDFNRDKFFIASYGNVEHPDNLTQWFGKQSDIWRDINELSPSQTADVIYNDKIDILIDLAGHTGGSNCALFGMQPAPVQVTWLGYPATTGLSTIQYRISDCDADPIGCENHYVENLKRLTHFLNYTPVKELPDIDLTDFDSRNETIFGSFNNIAKLSPDTIQLWALVLQSVPNSKLLIKHKNFNDPGVQQDFLYRFQEAGISSDRLIFHEFNFTDRGHMEEYNYVDIALDSYPYNGTTTTFEAMVMGVPTITLTGPVHAARVGTAINKGAGLPHYIASTPEEFVAIAKREASNRSSLKALKQKLRQQLLESPFSDHLRFTREFENALEEMWNEQCK